MSVRGEKSENSYITAGRQIKCLEYTRSSRKRLNLLYFQRQEINSVRVQNRLYNLTFCTRYDKKQIYIGIFTGVQNAVCFQRYYADKNDDKTSKEKKVDCKLTPKIVRDCKPEESVPCKPITKPICDQQVSPILLFY